MITADDLTPEQTILTRNRYRLRITGATLPGLVQVYRADSAGRMIAPYSAPVTHKHLLYAFALQEELNTVRPRPADRHDRPIGIGDRVVREHRTRSHTIVGTVTDIVCFDDLLNAYQVRVDWTKEGARRRRTHPDRWLRLVGSARGHTDD